MAARRKALIEIALELRNSGLGEIHPRVLTPSIAINKIDRQIIEAGNLLDQSGATKD